MGTGGSTLHDPAQLRGLRFGRDGRRRFAWTQRLLWRGQHKYVFNYFDYDELHDLAADPHEMHNLAPEQAFAPLAEEMSARMWQIIRQTGDFNMYDAQDGTYRYAPVGPESADQ